MADEVAEGAFLRGGALVLRDEGGERALRLPDALDRPRLQALLAAAAAALAVGAAPEALPSLRAPAFRSARVGRLGLTELVDDGMAATPAKTAAALLPRANRSVVLVAGGELESAGLAVHASPEEHALLARACAEARRVARLVVLFGPAAKTLAPLLDPRRTLVESSLDEAIAAAARHAEGAEALLVSPMFPLSLEERKRIAPALEEVARIGNTG